MIKIMKTYINAELQIVRVNNNDIVTASNVSVIPGATNTVDRAPQRRSIWD